MGRPRASPSVVDVTLTPEDVTTAAAALVGRVRRTPLLEVELGGRRVLLKLEHMQHSGSFKFRGAMLGALRSTSGDVVAASGGNHGLATPPARAAPRRGGAI